MIATAPDLLGLPFGHWSAAGLLDVGLALCCLLYLYGLRRISDVPHARATRNWPARRTACFFAGVAAVLIALQSGVGAYDDRLLSDHMVQHMLLLFVAPPLLLRGRPVTLALRAVRGSRRRALVRVLTRTRALTDPYLTIVAFSLVLLVAHMTGFFEATLRHPLLHEAEHAVFLLAGLLLWTPLLDANPLAARRLGGLGRLVYVLAAMPAMATLGAYLNRATHLVYPAYGRPARALGISALTDQAQAGAIMWVGGSMVLVVAGLWLTMAALSAEERRQRARELRAVVTPDGGVPS